MHWYHLPKVGLNSRILIGTLFLLKQETGCWACALQTNPVEKRVPTLLILFKDFFGSNIIQHVSLNLSSETTLWCYKLVSTIFVLAHTLSTLFEFKIWNLILFISVGISHQIPTCQIQVVESQLVERTNSSNHKLSSKQTHCPDKQVESQLVEWTKSGLVRLALTSSFIWRVHLFVCSQVVIRWVRTYDNLGSASWDSTSSDSATSHDTHTFALKFATCLLKAPHTFI